MPLVFHSAHFLFKYLIHSRVFMSTGARVDSVIFVISLKLNIFSFSASIITFSTQNHLILTYFTHFDTTHFFFYKYYNINKAGNSPPFFWLLDIMKFHLPRFNSKFLLGKSLSRRNSRGRRFLIYYSVYSIR